MTPAPGCSLAIAAGPRFEGDDLGGRTRLAFAEPVGEVDAGEPAGAAGDQVAVVDDPGVDDLGPRLQAFAVGAVGRGRAAVDQPGGAEQERIRVDAGDGPGRDYIVEPTVPIEDDPNLTDRRFPGNLTNSNRSRDPVRVAGEFTDWEGHAPGVLQEMKDHLERLKELGIEAIDLQRDALLSLRVLLSPA